MDQFWLSQRMFSVISIVIILLIILYNSNGKARLGVYCAANFAIEQVSAHEEIDIFNAVKTVRRHRSALIDNVVSLSAFHKLGFFFIYNLFFSFL